MKNISKSQLLILLGSLILFVLLYLAPNKSAKQLHREKLGIDAKINKAISLVQNGEQPMQGIMLLREVLEEETENTRAIYQLGVFSIQSGQYEKAIKRFEKLKKIEPDNTDALFYLAHSYANTEKIDLAIETFEEIKAKTENKELIREADRYIKELKRLKENAKR